MIKIIFSLILAAEVFAFWDKGGGPLFSHLFLTGAVFLIFCATLIGKFWRKKKGDRAGAEKGDSMGDSAGTEIVRQSGAHNFLSGLPLISYVLFFLFFALSLFTALTPEYSLAETLLFANAGLLIYILSCAGIKKKDLHWFSIALISLLTVDTLIGFFAYTKMPFGRLVGTFMDFGSSYIAFGNAYANTLILILPLAIWQLFRKHERVTTTVVAALSTGILLTGFLLSFSRGAWISALVLCVIFIVWFFWKRGERKAAGVFVNGKNICMRILAVMILTLIFVNCLQFVRGQKYAVTPLLHKATFQAEEGFASASDRMEFWRGAVQLIGERPFFGAGILSFKFLFPQVQKTFGIAQSHPHNIFLKIGVENGLVAVGFFLIFLIAVGGMGLKFLRDEPWHPALFLFLGGLGALGQNFIDFNFIASNFTLFICFISVGINFAVGRGEEKSVNEPVSKINTFLAGKIIFSVFFLASGALLFLGIHEGFYNIYFKQGRAAIAAKDYVKAQEKLVNAEKLFFKRDLVSYEALIFQKLYENSKKAGAPNAGWLIEEQKVLESAARKTVDASIFSRLGEIYLEQGDAAGAEKMFLAALNLDPSNRFRYYYNLFQVKKALGEKPDPIIETQVRNFLDKYTTDLLSNAHITILTDNPAYASLLYEYFGMNEEKKLFDQIWFNELVKFTVLYGGNAVAAPKY